MESKRKSKNWVGRVVDWYKDLAIKPVVKPPLKRSGEKFIGIKIDLLKLFRRKK